MPEFTTVHNSKGPRGRPREPVAPGKASWGWGDSHHPAKAEWSDLPQGAGLGWGDSLHPKNGRMLMISTCERPFHLKKSVFLAKTALGSLWRLFGDQKRPKTARFLRVVRGVPRQVPRGWLVLEWQGVCP